MVSCRDSQNCRASLPVGEYWKSHCLMPHRGVTLGSAWHQTLMQVLHLSLPLTLVSQGEFSCLCFPIARNCWKVGILRTSMGCCLPFPYRCLTFLICEMGGIPVSEVLWWLNETMCVKCDGWHEMTIHKMVSAAVIGSLWAADVRLHLELMGTQRMEKISPCQTPLLICLSFSTKE